MHRIMESTRIAPDWGRMCRIWSVPPQRRFHARDPSSILAALAALIAPAARAQEITATIAGTVTDQSGAVLPGVTVVARNVGKGFTTEAVTTDTGRYTLPYLINGEYEIIFTMSGFKTLRGEGHQPARERPARGERLARGAAWRRVEVTASAELIQPTPAVQNLMGSTQVQELPLNNRNFVQLATLVPGVSVAPRRGRHRPHQHGQPLHQRRAAQRHQLVRGRGLERGRRLEHHPALDPDPGVHRGVQDHHLELRGRVAAQRRRHHQRGDQVRQQHLPGLRLRVLSERRPEREHLLPQAEHRTRRSRPPPSRAPAAPIRTTPRSSTITTSAPPSAAR